MFSAWFYKLRMLTKNDLDVYTGQGQIMKEQPCPSKLLDFILEAAEEPLTSSGKAAPWSYLWTNGLNDGMTEDQKAISETLHNSQHER